MTCQRTHKNCKALKLGLPLVLCLCLASFSVAQDVVSVATTKIPPYTGNEIETTGFLSDIVRSAFSAVNIEAKLGSLPWARAKSVLIMGQVDAMFPSSFSELEELGALKVLLYKTSPLVFVKRKNNRINWNGRLRSIGGRNVGVLRGFSYTQEFDQAKNFQKVSASNNEKNINSLNQKKLDLTIMDELTANFYIHNYGLKDKLEILTPSLISSTEFYMGFSPANRSREREYNGLIKGLAIIKENGDYQKILEKYRVNDQVFLKHQKVKAAGLVKVSPLTKPKGSGVHPKVIKKNIKDIVIGFCGFHWQTDGYQKRYEQIIHQQAKQQDFTLINYDAKASLDLQISQIETLIEKQVDVIAVWPVHGKKILPVLNKAKQAGIPVLVVNTPIDVSGFDLIRGYTGPNNVEEGKLAAQMMIKALHGKGHVVEIQGFPGYSTAIERSSGFSNELDRQKHNNPDITMEIVDVAAGYWSREKSRQAAKHLARRIDHFDGLFVADDNMAVGAMEYLESIGRLENLIITSATLFADGYDAIKAGKIYGSVWQDPAADASIAIEVAIEIAKGQEIEFFNFFKTPKVNRKNISSFKRPSF